MYGAILGDIAGSRIEFSRPKGFDHKREPLFVGACRFTDDTVLTVATKYAILNNISYAKAYNMFGKKYRKAGFGNMFQEWLDNNSRKGYKSFGNGAAMRVSFIGNYFNTLEEVHYQAELSASCTHDHERGTVASKATAGMIFLAKNGHDKKDIKKYLKANYNYSINKPLFMYRPTSKFDPTADATMPIVIRCFLESKSWEDCMRKAFSIKCDTDTVCCIAGGIAEAYYKKTGMDDIRILERYLIKPDDNGNMDRFLFEWATKK